MHFDFSWPMPIDSTAGFGKTENSSGAVSYKHESHWLLVSTVLVAGLDPSVQYTQ